MSAEVLTEKVNSLDNEAFMEKFTKVDGRLNRLRFFLRSLALGVLATVVGVALMIEVSESVGMAVYTLLILGQFPLDIRRCHDMGKSGWLTLLLFVPFVNMIWVLVLLFKKGTEGENAYGPDPLAE